MDEFLWQLGRRPFLLPRLRDLEIQGDFNQEVLGRVIYSRICATDDTGSEENCSSATDLVPLRSFSMKATNDPLDPHLADIVSRVHLCVLIKPES